jgi:hypothetical protein
MCIYYERVSYIMNIAPARPPRRLNILISEALAQRALHMAESRGVTLSKFIRDAVEKECDRSRERQLADAAGDLAPLYAKGSDLTVFSALDGEDFQ